MATFHVSRCCSWRSVLIAVVILCPTLNAQSTAPRRSREVDCREVLIETALLTGVLVTDAVWQSAERRLQPLINCLPPNTDSVLILNTTEVMQPGRTVITEGRNVMFTSLQAFNERLELGGVDTEAVSMPRFRCHPKQPFLQIQGSNVTLDHIGIQDCQLRRGPVISVTGSLTVRNSIFQRISANGSPSVIKANAVSSVVVQNTVFRNNRGPVLIRAVRSARVQIQQSQFVRNRPSGIAAILVDRNEGLQIEDSEFRQHVGRILHLQDTSATLHNTTFTSNTADRGTVLFTEGLRRVTEVKLRQCRFEGNEARKGAGCVMMKGQFLSVELHDITARDNTAQRGAVLWSSDVSYLLINSSDFSNNAATNYGGTLVSTTRERSQGALVVQRSRFFLNSARSGGALSLDGPLETELSDSCRFFNNTASRRGGAIRIGKDVQLSASHATFQFNRAISGGSIYGRGEYGNRQGTVLSFSQSDFVQNLATQGGAICVSTAALQISNGSSLQNNSARKHGGAVYAINGAQISLKRTRLVQNSAPEGGAISAVDEQFNKLRIQLSSETLILNNTASIRGGGLHLMGKGVGLNCTDNVQLQGNRAELEGGGIYLGDGFEFRINETAFFSNTALQGGALYATARGREVDVVMGLSHFQDNEAETGGGIFLDGQRILRFQIQNRTAFLSNRAHDRGGAILSAGPNSLTLQGALFVQNRADQMGGAIATQQGEVAMEVMESAFQGNEATAGGAVAMEDSGLLRASSNVNFTENRALSGGALFLTSGVKLNISQTLFLNNTASGGREGGGAIFCQALGSESMMEIRESAFLMNRAKPQFNSEAVPITTSGGALHLTGAVLASFQSVQMADNEALWDGGAVFLTSGSHLEMMDCEMMANQADQHGGGIYAANITNSSFIQDSVFSLNSALSGGALYLAHALSPLKLSRMRLEGNSARLSGGAIVARDVSLELTESDFLHNRAGRGRFNHSTCPETPIPHYIASAAGGAVHVQSQERTDITLDIRETRFENNTAHRGGALSMVSLSNAVISQSRFLQNRALLGGAVWIQDTPEDPSETATLVNSSFVRNQGCQGGAIYGRTSSSNSVEHPSVALVNPRFQKNFAALSGAALHTPDTPKSFSLCCSCSEAAALTPLSSAFVESLPQECRSEMPGNSVSNEGYGPLFSTDSVGFEITPVSIHHHRSGDLLKAIVVRDVDALDQTVPSSDQELYIDATDAILEGENHTHMHDGMALFDGLFLTAQPGNYSLMVLENEVLIGEIAVSVAPCQVGERLEGMICVDCEEGSYVETGNGECQPCPDHAICGEGRITPRNGYWNNGPDSTKILKCIRPDACRAEPFSIDPVLTDPCHEGYEGALCGACVEGYGHVDGQECQECHQESSRFFAGFLVLYLIFVTFMLIKTSWVWNLTIPHETPPPETAIEMQPPPEDASTVTGEGDADADAEVEAQPIPEHLEPVASFGIRSAKNKDPRKALLERVAGTSTNLALPVKQTRSAPTSPTTSPRQLPPVTDATTSTPSRQEITPEPQFIKASPQQLLDIEGLEAISESHVLLKPLLSEALKILLTFFQSVSLALYIQINWSSPLRAILRLFHFLGTGSSPYFSLECVFNEDSDTPASIKAATYILSGPIFVSLLFILIWFLFFLLDRSISVFWQRVKNSLVAVFYLSFLPICHTSFRVLNCTSLSSRPDEGEDAVWIEDTDVICYKGAHLKLLYLTLPLLFLNVIVFPFSFAVFLLIHRNLGKTQHLRSWGLLFEAYKYKRRYWEFTIFLRRLSLAAVFAFGYHFSIQTQTLIAIGVIVLFLLIHSINSPYEKPERMLSHMETISLFAAFLVYFGACLINALDVGNDVIFVVLCVVLILIFVRLLGGVLQHMVRAIDWTLGEYGKENYYSKPWMTKIGMVLRLKCSYMYSRVQRLLKRRVH